MLIRVLEIPKSSGELCSGGGNVQEWIEVGRSRDDVTAFYEPLMQSAEGRKMVEESIKRRSYFDPEKSYLVLHQEHSFTIGYKAE